MRKRSKWFVVIIMIIGVFAFAFVMIDRNLESMSKVQRASIDLTTVEDGLYSGSAAVFPISAKVSVLVENHRIVAIYLLEFVTGQGDDAAMILDEVIAQQRLDVDVISGSTYSSNIILMAIEDALKNTCD